MYSNASNDTNSPEYHDSVPDNFTEESLDYAQYAYDNSHQDFQYGEYIYSVFKFELPIYLYIWEILVIIVSLVNCFVVVILLNKRMRNPTSTILVALSVSDSLTGLVIVPSYIQVFMKYKAANPFANGIDLNNSTIGAEQNLAYIGSCVLDKQLCQFFMISKYFVSPMFHTISIYLTLFLSCQRYISVGYPFKAQRIFSERNTVIMCVCIFLISPVLHIYQVLNEKTQNGLCVWLLDDCSTGGCAYIWIIFFLRHFLPCVLLLVVTGLFIRQLMKGEENLKRMSSNASQISCRSSNNRRISYVVVAIVVVFLVTELPHGIFLFTTAVLQINNDLLPFKTNRSIQAAYEISLVLSFHVNFYIYIVFNKTFRNILKRKFAFLISTLFSKPTSVLKNSLFTQDYRKTTDSCSASCTVKSIGTQPTNSDEQMAVTQQETSKCLHNITSTRL